MSTETALVSAPAGVSPEEYSPNSRGTVGYRFWRLGESGELHAPIGCGDWNRGLNVAGCLYSCDREEMDCGSCGFYACVHRERGVCEHYSFDPSDATVIGYGPSGSNYDMSLMAIFGSVVLFDPRSIPINSRVRAGHGFVAALSLPPTPTARVVAAAEAAAEAYDVPLVRPNDLHAAALACLARAEGSASRR